MHKEWENARKLGSSNTLAHWATLMVCSLKKLDKEYLFNFNFTQNILGENLPICPFIAFGRRETAQKTNFSNSSIDRFLFTDMPS